MDTLEEWHLLPVDECNAAAGPVNVSDISGSPMSFLGLDAIWAVAFFSLAAKAYRPAQNLLIELYSGMVDVIDDVIDDDASTLHGSGGTHAVVDSAATGGGIPNDVGGGSETALAAGTEAGARTGAGGKEGTGDGADDALAEEESSCPSKSLPDAVSLASVRKWELKDMLDVQDLYNDRANVQMWRWRLAEVGVAAVIGGGWER